MSPDPLLGTADAAARAGMKTSSWRAAVARKDAPPPDDPDLDTPLPHRRTKWKTSTVDAWLAERPGQGHRSDLDAARAERRRRDAADLAAPPPVVRRDLQAWLTANHRALLAVAEFVTDHRDALVAAAGPTGVALAEAIDHAGERMSGRPSLAMASAVMRAIGLLPPDLPGGRAGLEDELSAARAFHARTRGEFDRVRPPREI